MVFYSVLYDPLSDCWLTEPPKLKTDNDVDDFVHREDTREGKDKKSGQQVYHPL